MIKAEHSFMIKKKILLYQGIYYALTGIWPVLSINSFLWISGPKTDLWLVKTVGFILLSEGICFITDSITHRISLSACLLAVLNIIFLVTVDVYYSLNGVISPVYLLDAGIQAVFGCLWMAAVIGREKKSSG
jgi:hypothetical protein